MRRRRRHPSISPSRLVVLFGWLAVWLAAHGSASAQPTITRPVTDEAGVLSTAASEAIEARLMAHRDAGHAQIALLLIRTTSGEPITDYANRAATAWGGGTATADDGVLFVLAIDDHEMRIEVGYGLEATITDAIAMQILDELVAPLREGRFDAAAWAVSDALIARTGGQSLPMPDGLATLSPRPAETLEPAGSSEGARFDAMLRSEEAESRRARHRLEEEQAEWRYLLIAIAVFVVPTLLVFLFLWRGTHTSYGADGVARTDWSGVVPIAMGLGVAMIAGLFVVAWLGWLGLLVGGLGVFVILARSVGGGSGRARAPRRERAHRSHRSRHASSSVGGGSFGGGGSYGGRGGGFGGGGASKRW